MNRINFQILLGAILVLVTSTIVLVYGFNEETRMAQAAESQRGRAIEQGAGLFEQQCSRCHGTQGKGIAGLCPPLNDRNFFDNRLKDVGWSGTLEDYIVATASSGRLVSTRPQTYPGQGMPAMPAFHQSYGGPLREDQIRNIATFILNWESTATLVEVPAAPTGPTAGTDITKPLPEGDAAAGEAKATSLGCVACHIAAPTGPHWLANDQEPGVGTRAAARIGQPDYTGAAQSDVQYLFEAIVSPNVYVVPGFAPGIMPQNYGNTLTDQDMADLVAYLLSLK
ncbi:MAG: c-type cytochrome [Chloroflexota bacterium]